MYRPKEGDAARVENYGTTVNKEAMNFDTILALDPASSESFIHILFVGCLVL